MERGFLSPGRGVKEKSNTAAIKQPTVKSILKKPSVVANKHETTDHNSGNQPSSMHVNVQSFGNKNLQVDELDKMKKVSDQNHNRDDLVPPVQSNEQNLNTTVEPKKVDEQPSNANRTSYLNVVTAETSKVQVNFRSLQSEVSVAEADVTIPLSSVEEVNNRFLNTLYGYFIGKRIAFPVVENYVRNVWSKYGLQKVMMNAKGFFFFKFSTNKGMNDALENGPWMIRTSPIILNQWTPNISLAKEDLSKVPVWVKLHDVPMAAFTADGLSMIATMLGTPMRLDSYTATMCQESWGRSSFARALIEIHSNLPLKDVIVVAIPNLDGSGYTKENVRVEYEWKPPRCDVCALFGHSTNQCPSSSVQKNPSDGFVEVGSKGSKVNKEGQTARKVQGVSLGKQKSNFVYRPKVATNKEKPKQKEDTHVSTSNPFSVLSGSDNKMDDVIREVETSKRDGKAVHGSKETVPKETVSKVDNLEDDESDIEEVYNETSYFMASGLGSGTGGGGPSNLEFFDEDDFYDDYRDQVYDLTEEQENWCKAFDINLRGQIKKKKK